MRAVSAVAVAYLSLAASAPAYAGHTETSSSGQLCPRQQAVNENRLPSSLRTGTQEAIINGVRLWYRVAGQGSPKSSPVVFLHGGPGSSSQSLATFGGPLLECSHRMIYFDQRGSGRSERPWTQDYALRTLIEDIEGLRRHLRVPQIALLAHSFGTVLALEYAAAYPQNVSHLIITGGLADASMSGRSMCARLKETDPAAHQRAIEGSEDGQCNVFKAFRGRDAEAFFRSNMFPDPGLAERLKQAETAAGLRNTGELQRAVFDAGLLKYRFEQFDRLRMPVLVISGAKDYQVGLEGPRSLAARLPNARALEYAESGHFMFAEEPERFARDVSDFLKSR